MRTRRAYAVAVAAWVLVVAVGSTLVWAVISRAGEGVVSGVDAAPTLGVPQPVGPTSTARPRRPSPRPSAPSGHVSRSPDRTTDSSPPAPTTTPGPPPASTAPTRGSTTGPASPPIQQPASPQPSASRRTWQGRAGVVVAECSGSRIRLVGAYPNSGWSVQVEERGPQRLAVHFEGNDDQGETELGARCVQGSPAYDASSDG